MDVGFILLNVRTLYEKEVYNKLKNLKEVEEVYPLFGEYDFIIKIQMENLDLIGKNLIKKIRTIKGIIKTETLSGIKF